MDSCRRLSLVKFLINDRALRLVLRNCSHVRASRLAVSPELKLSVSYLFPHFPEALWLLTLPQMRSRIN